MLDECEYPAAPGAIGDNRRKLTGVKIGCLGGDVFNRALAAGRIERTKESLGLVYSHHASARAHEAGKIQRSVSGAATDIQHRWSGADPRRVPRVQHALAPRAVLQTEPLDLFVV